MNEGDPMIKEELSGRCEDEGNENVDKYGDMFVIEQTTNQLLIWP
jgi:hypothetical protein